MSTMRVVVTGATGQVAYALLPRIAAGEMFGPDVEIDLRLSDIPAMIDKAKGALMELEDGAYPLLERMTASSDRAESHQRARAPRAARRSRDPSTQAHRASCTSRAGLVATEPRRAPRAR